MKRTQNVLAAAFSAVFILIVPSSVFAATSPSLGAASSYSVLSGAGATNGGSGMTTISGNFGVYPASSYTDLAALLTSFLTAGNPHLGDTSAQNAQAAQLAVFNGPAGIDAASQPCTVNYSATTELSTLGALDPGVYCTDALHDFTLSGTLTLHGTGSPATDVWIFRSERDLVGTGTASVVFTGTGGYACNVWWRVANTATFTAGNAFLGNILAHTSITFGQGASLDGRAFAYSAAVTLLGNTISGPTCGPVPGTLHIIKAVTGSNASPSSFQVHVKTSGSDVAGSPAAGASSPGTQYSLLAGTYSVSEDANSSYRPSFSGDCDSQGSIQLNSGSTLTCTVTNTLITTGRSGGGSGRLITPPILSTTTPVTQTVSTTTTTFSPGLPNTGLPPKDGSSSWNLLISLAILSAMIALLSPLRTIWAYASK